LEIDAGNGVRVSGRIDLIRHRDTDEVVVIDFKSNDRTQAEEVTDLQLHVYALGYKQGAGRGASAVAVTNLDDLSEDRQLAVTEESLEEARAAVQRVADLLRLNDLPKDPRGESAEEKGCGRCDLIVLCREAV
jgi:DNA helicase-2/ATP-dependent DNA helicase PcrA